MSPSQTERLVISGAVHKLFYGRAWSRGSSSAGISVIMLSSLMVSAIFRSVCDQAGWNHAEVSPLVFTNGEDTRTFGGIISADRHQVRFSDIWLAVESNIIITQLVNITNVGFSKNPFGLMTLVFSSQNFLDEFAENFLIH